MTHAHSEKMNGVDGGRWKSILTDISKHFTELAWFSRTLDIHKKQLNVYVKRRCVHCRNWPKTETPNNLHKMFALKPLKLFNIHTNTHTHNVSIIMWRLQLKTQFSVRFNIQHPKMISIWPHFRTDFHFGRSFNWIEFRSIYERYVQTWSVRVRERPNHAIVWVCVRRLVN